MSRRTVALIFALASAAACNKSDTSAGQGDTTAAAAQAGDAGGDALGKVHVVVTGGPHAGTYDATMREGGCSYGYAGEGTWGNQYSITPTDPKEFSSLQLVVPNAKAAAGGTKEFLMTVGFGPLTGNYTTYDIDTRPDANTKRGSGTVTVDDRGNSGKVTFSGQTKEGVKLEGTIDCARVARAG